MKTEVYSWRVSSELKTGLEREARRRKISLSAVLDVAAREWLNKSGEEKEGAEEQLRLHEAASQYIGAIEGGNVHRSENVRQDVRQRLRLQHDR